MNTRLRKSLTASRKARLARESADKAKSGGKADDTESQSSPKCRQAKESARRSPSRKIGRRRRSQSSPHWLHFDKKDRINCRKRRPRDLDKDELRMVLGRIRRHSPNSESDLAVTLATFRAGMRPIEIAGLTRRTLCDATGHILPTLTILPGTSKRNRGRQIHLHPELRDAFQTLFDRHPDAKKVAFTRRPDGSICYKSASSIVEWFRRLYAASGLMGVTGMSGRHTFATEAARNAPLVGGSIRDVQLLMGHANLATTSRYVHSTANVQALIESLGR